MRFRSVLARLVALAAPALWAGTTLLALAWPGGADAHGLRLSVQSDGLTVRGLAFYADGTPAAGTRVSFHGPELGETAAAIIDPQGRFSATLAADGAVRVVVEDDEGHRAETRVTLAAPAVATGEPSLIATSSAVTSPAAPTLDAGALRGALRDELAPLREQIDRLDQRVRLSDAIGGIGLLVGLAGGYALLRARRRS